MAAARERARSIEVRAAVARWLWIILFSVVIPGGLVAYGAYNGSIGGRPEDARRIAKLLALGGIWVLYTSQVVAALYVFTRSFAQGMLSLVVPGYFVLALRRSKAFYPVVVSWLLGVIALAAGTILLS